MPSRVTVLAGRPQSGKTEWLLRQYRLELREKVPGRTLWIAPTWRAVSAVRDRLLVPGLVGCFRPGIMTFANFAEAVLEASPAPIRPLSGPMKRQLLRRLLDEQTAQGRLHHFRPIAHTGGLVDLVGEFISELKRLEIWPDHFRSACQARGISEKDNELLEIYESYQQSLQEHQLFDAEGRFWSARNWLQQGQHRPFEALRFVVVDGFSDFTRTQHEILEILANRVESLYVTLTLESDTVRPDLFAKPLKTLAELQRRHSHLESISSESLTERSTSTVASWPAWNHIERQLFVNPRQAKRADSTVGIEILAAAKPLGEMEMIAARIKRLLAEEGVSPNDIAVVFRSQQEPNGLAGEVFERFGLPVAWETGMRLDRSPLLRALIALLKLDRDDWPFHALLAVLGSNYFQPDWPEWQNGHVRIEVERTIRSMQIPRGRQALFDELARRRAVSLSSDESALREDPFARDDSSVETFLVEATPPVENPTSVILERLASLFDELPRKATLPQWAMAWEQLARQTGMLRGIFTDSGPLLSFLPENDAAAWKYFLSVMSAGDRLAGWMDQRPPEVNGEDAFNALKDILGSERLPILGEESGRIRILSAASVRSLHIPYLFLAGLSEKAFPQPDREDRLYSESEYLRLIEEGLPFVARTERNREEMLLFYEAVTRATKRLTLSYPALDASAQPLSPSPFLLEVEQACGEGAIARIEDTDFRPVSQTEVPLCPADFRVAAMRRALDGNYYWLAGLRQIALFPTTAPFTREKDRFRFASNLFAGLELTMLRQDREQFGPAEGIFIGTEARRQILAEFPSTRTFSVTELEGYARCPFRFLVERILKIAPLDDVVLESDFLERGQSIHEVLATFHQRANELMGKPSSPLALNLEDYHRLMQSSIEDSLPSSTGNSVRAALREVDRRMILRWLDEYRRQYEKYDSFWTDCESPLVPEFFEISFGSLKYPSKTWAIDTPLVLMDADDMIRLSGRIDRVDTGKVAHCEVFNILDYKTGTSSKFSLDEFLRGVALQLPVYSLAVMELFLNDRDARPWQAGYWLVADKGFRHNAALIMYRLVNGQVELQPEWETVRDLISQIVFGLVRNLRNGIFPVYNRDLRCGSSCPFRTICRINQIRSLEKNLTPTRVTSTLSAENHDG